HTASAAGPGAMMGEHPPVEVIQMSARAPADEAHRHDLLGPSAVLVVAEPAVHELVGPDQPPPSPDTARPGGARLLHQEPGGKDTRVDRGPPDARPLVKCRRFHQPDLR